MWTLTTTLKAKTGDVIEGVAGETILDGGNVVPESFDGSGSAVDVMIRSLVVQHYNAKGLRLNTGWIADGVESRYNAEGVAILGNGAILENSSIHDNGQVHITGMSNSFGVASNTATNAQVLGNDIYDNNTGCNPVAQDGGGAGASKFWDSSGFLLAGNTWHDNYGNGIWLDGSSTDFTIVDETTLNNTSACPLGSVGGGQGIRIEVSCGNVIDSNTVSGNSLGGIFLDDSFGDTVQNNSISLPASATVGMRSLDVARTAPNNGSYFSTCGGGGFNAEHNQFIQNDVTYSTTKQRSGTWQGSGQDTANNSFQGNVYHTPSCAYKQWVWLSTGKLWTKWVTVFGQDVTGSCG